jgi:hypothetical protein
MTTRLDIMTHRGVLIAFNLDQEVFEAAVDITPDSEEKLTDPSLPALKEAIEKYHEQLDKASRTALIPVPVAVLTERPGFQGWQLLRTSIKGVVAGRHYHPTLRTTGAQLEMKARTCFFHPEDARVTHLEQLILDQNTLMARLDILRKDIEAYAAQGHKLRVPEAKTKADAARIEPGMLDGLRALTPQKDEA